MISNVITFYKIDLSTGSSTTYTADLSAFTSSVSFVYQAMYDSLNSSVYILGGLPDYVILKGTLQPSDGTVVGLTQVGISPISADGYGTLDYMWNLIYFNTYFDIATQSLKSLRSSIVDYYTASAVQVYYRYQICKGNLTSFTIDASSPISFSKKCNDDNGIYFQNNTFLQVIKSSECAGWISSANNGMDLLSCPSIATQQSDFIDSTCTASIDTVCATAYTDNPPFSCSRDVYPGWLTSLGTALANSVRAWSFFCKVVCFWMKKRWPTGVANPESSEPSDATIKGQQQEHQR